MRVSPYDTAMSWLETNLVLKELTWIVLYGIVVVMILLSGLLCLDEQRRFSLQDPMVQNQCCFGSLFA